MRTSIVDEVCVCVCVPFDHVPNVRKTIFHNELLNGEVACVHVTPPTDRSDFLQGVCVQGHELSPAFVSSTEESDQDVSSCVLRAALVEESEPHSEQDVSSCVLRAALVEESEPH